MKKLNDNIDDNKIQPQDVSNQETVIDQHNLDNYQLVMDRERRQVRPNLKCISSNWMKFILI